MKIGALKGEKHRPKDSVLRPVLFFLLLLSYTPVLQLQPGVLFSFIKQCQGSGADVGAGHRLVHDDEDVFDGADFLKAGNQELGVFGAIRVGNADGAGDLIGHKFAELLCKGFDGVPSR